MHLDEKALNIYTDGSCYHSPRVGGVGFLLVTVDENGNEVIYEECPPGWKSATNNQMELQACIEALSHALSRYSPIDISDYSRVVIYTDSMYVAENFDKAKWVWPKARWTTSGGRPVANTKQWRELLGLVKNAGRVVEVKWVKAHKSDALNKRVDKLARASAKASSNRTLGPMRVRRKKSPNQVESGSVRMEGQVTTIRIITDEYLPSPHRLYTYKYEVMDEESPYYQKVDKASSQHVLGAGHTYVVRFNEDQQNPWIEEVIQEIALASAHQENGGTKEEEQPEPRSSEPA